MKKLMLKSEKILLLLALLVTTFAFNKVYAKAADASVTPVKIESGKETAGTSNTVSGKIVPTTDGSRRFIIEINTDCSGLMSFDFKGNHTDKLFLTLFTEEACTNQIGITSVDPSSDTIATDNFAIPKAGTYYLELESYEAADIDFTILPYIVSSDDGKLSNKEVKYVSLTSYDDSNYYKIVLKKAGVIIASNTNLNGEATYATVDICNSKKKVISQGNYYNEGTVAGLPKGTYYIKLSGGTDYYKIGYQYYSISEKSGSSKAKAGSLKLGKESEGLILTTDKTTKADWYKFKTTKKKAITVSVYGEVTGGVTIDVMDSKGDSFGKLYISDYTKEAAGSPYFIGKYDGKLPKGTYYIKVTKDNKDVSGYYSIMVK